MNLRPLIETLETFLIEGRTPAPEGTKTKRKDGTYVKKGGKWERESSWGGPASASSGSSGDRETAAHMASQHAKETGKARDHASAADAHQRQAHRAEDEGDTEAAKYHKREMERHDKEAKAQYDKMDQNHPDRAGLSAYEDDLETRLSKVPDLRHKISKSDLEAYQQDLQYMGSRADRESKWADDLPQSKSAEMSHATAAHDHTGAAVLAFQIGDRKKGEYHKNKALYHDKAATKLGY